MGGGFYYMIYYKGQEYERYNAVIDLDCILSGMKLEDKLHYLDNLLYRIKVLKKTNKSQDLKDYEIEVKNYKSRLLVEKRLMW